MKSQPWFDMVQKRSSIAILVLLLYVYEYSFEKEQNDDIDQILKYGEERTKQENERIKKSMDQNLLNFKTNGDERDIYLFEGENFRTKGMLQPLLYLPQRERKRIYNIDENGFPISKTDSGDSSHVTTSVSATTTERKKTVYPYQDFQLYNVKELEKLLDKEQEYFYQEKIYLKVLNSSIIELFNEQHISDLKDLETAENKEEIQNEIQKLERQLSSVFFWNLL